MRKCLRNADCVSGYCDYNYCSLQPGHSDPCKPNQCYAGQVCDSYTGRCQYKSDAKELAEKRRLKVCDFDHECPVNSFCDEHNKCAKRKGFGGECFLDKDCQDGLYCHGERCARKCFKDNDCPSGEACTGKLYTEDFKLCEPKPPEVKEEPPVVKEVPPIVKEEPPIVKEEPSIHMYDHSAVGQQHGTMGYSILGVPLSAVLIWGGIALGIFLLVLTIIIWSSKRRKRPQAAPMPPFEPLVHSPYASFPAPMDSPLYGASGGDHPSPSYHNTSMGVASASHSSVVLPPSYEESAGAAADGADARAVEPFQKQ